MNENHPVETQLRSWTPRRPSAKLKARLFGKKHAGARLLAKCLSSISISPFSIFRRPSEAWASEPAWHPAWRWFAPIAGVCLLTSVMVRDHNLSSVYLTGSQANSIFAAAALSNQTLASYVTTPDAFDRNALPKATFASTTEAPSAPSIGSFLLFNTNSLMR